MKIEIHKPDEKELKENSVKSWPIWEKEVSKFDWYYDSREECYLIEGEVEVTTENGETVTFGKGDYVKFPQGLSCKWNITKPVKKHYIFK